MLLAIKYPERQNVLRAHWGSVRSYIARRPVQSKLNYRLVSRNTRSMELRKILEEQTTAFIINISYGFILQHRQSRRLTYYHSSYNCRGRFLEKPCLVTNAVSFDAFLESIHDQDGLISQRQNSDWVCVMVTNATLFVNIIFNVTRKGPRQVGLLNQWSGTHRDVAMSCLPECMDWPTLFCNSFLPFRYSTSLLGEPGSLSIVVLEASFSQM